LLVGTSLLARRSPVTLLLAPLLVGALLVRPGDVLSLLAGCALAIGAARGIQLPSSWRLSLAASLVLALAVVTGAGGLASHLALTVLPGAILVSHGARELPALAWRPLVALGRISYGLYLWHAPIVVIILPALATTLPMIAALAITIAASLLAAINSYRWIERPFLLARQKRPPLAKPPEGQVVLLEVGGVVGAAVVDGDKPLIGPIIEEVAVAPVLS
jgi:peptidoglycan/LPS O-acetylase OafA/YrhL